MSIEARRHQYGTVFGHWRIKESLGQGSGGKSAVFRLEHAESDSVESALKVVSLIEENGSLLELSPQRRAEYERSCMEYSQWANQEVLLMNQLQGNTYIVDYLDHTFVDWSDETGFGRDMLIRMERLTDLRGRIRRGIRFSHSEIVKIGMDICNALILCHGKNILHRDIKPGNIFINKDGNYKLGDFGISKILDSSATFMASTGIGTPQYWAPEQTSGQYDKRVDIYSLGLVLYELSNANRLPFASSGYVRESEVQRRLMGEQLPVPCEADGALAAVILKACAFRPEDRYPTAEAFRDALAMLEYGRGFGVQAYMAEGEQTVSAVGYTTPAGGRYATPQSYAGPVSQGYGTPVQQGYVQQQTGGQWGYGTPAVQQTGPQRGTGKKKGLGLLIGILVLLLALLLGGALWWLRSGNDSGGKDDRGEETVSTDAVEGKEQTPGTTAAVEPAQASVSDAVSECVSYAYAAKGYLCYHIPQVELEEGRGADISGVIYDELNGILEEQVRDQSVPSLSAMYYSWGRRGNTLSVLVRTEATTYDWTEYYTYHVSAKSGKILEDDYLITTFGLSRAGFQERLAEKLQAFYASRQDQIVAAVGESGLNELIARSVAEANLAEAMPYIGGDGELCAVVYYYWYAGADCYPMLVNLTGTTEPEAPSCTVTHDPAQALKAALAKANVGDTITFGSYEQDNNIHNGPEAIQWKVLEKENGKLMLISCYALDCRQYNDTLTAATWETCSLRAWLNSTFYDGAFTDTEKQMIPTVLVSAEQNPYYGNAPGNDTYDKVYLLSPSEVKTYFRTDAERMCYATAYAKTRGSCWIDSRWGTSWWWLRGVGEFTTDACNVSCDGSIDYKDGTINGKYAVVRPVIWIEVE